MAEQQQSNSYFFAQKILVTKKKLQKLRFTQSSSKWSVHTKQNILAY